MGRLTWAPTVSGDENNLLHLGVGYRYTDAKEGLRFRSEPEFNKAPNFVDTGRNLQDGLINGGETDIASIGANWWLTRTFQFGVNYRYIWNTLDEIDGISSGISTRILIVLE